MSTYYSYYIGYIDTNNKLHAYGPYDRFGNLEPVIWRSRSYASDMFREFSAADIDMLDEELKKKFVYDSGDRTYCTLYYLSMSLLPSGSYIKDGYFLMEEISEYLETNSLSIFEYSNKFSITHYAKELEMAVKNNDENRISELKQYTYFSYPDYTCEEYESFVIRNALTYTFSDWQMKSRIKETTDSELKDIIVLLDID